MDYDKLIDKHFGVLMNYKSASIEHYIKTGTVSGTFRSALKDMLKEACECETSDENNNCNKPLVSNRIFEAVIADKETIFVMMLTATDETDASMKILDKYPESASVVRELPFI